MSGSQSLSPLRNIEKVLDDSQHTGELVLTGRKLKCFPKNSSKYDLVDTNRAELSRNQFSEVPEEVCQFPSLEHLNLSHNLIRCLSHSLTNLHELVELNISHNLLYQFPPFLCQLRHLQVLSLNGNKINSIPEEIGQLWKLTSLDVSCNELTHLPNQLGDLSSLKDFNLRRNQLIELPICLTRLRLCRLDVSCNRIAHIPCDFRKVTSLEEIHVEGNPLVSPPAHLCLRGLVHIMKFLHKEATKHEQRSGLTSAGSIQRRLKRSSSFSTTSDGKMVGLDRNRSYNLGASNLSHGLALLGRNFSVDKSDKTEPVKLDRVNTIESSTTSTRPVQDICTSIENTSFILGLHRSRNMSSHNLATTPSVLLGSNATSTTSNPINNKSVVNKISATTTDVLSNNINNSISKSNSSDLSNNSSLTTQAQTASQQLEMWLNGLQSNRAVKSSNSTAKIEVPKTSESSDAITKELLRQKAESEAKKKKIESLRSRLDAAKSEAEKNSILHQYSLDLRADAGSANNIASEKLFPTQPSTTSSIIPSSSSSTLPITAWSNANTLPRCGPTNALDQAFAKQKMKLPALKIPTFRKTSEDGEAMKSTTNKEVKQNKNLTIRTNGTMSSDAKNGSLPSKADANKNNMNDKEKAQVDKMRKSIEALLKVSLPVDNLESSLKDGVILCHLVNHVKPRAVSCIHVSSQSAPVLSLPKIRRNVDNFLLACKRVGVDQSSICQASAIVDEFNPVSLSMTVNALVSNYSRSA